MYRNNRSQLTPWLEDVYETLASEICQQEDDHGLGTDRARELLHAEDLIEADAQYAVERLLDRGYLYTVDGELFVTEPNRES